MSEVLLHETLTVLHAFDIFKFSKAYQSMTNSAELGPDLFYLKIKDLVLMDYYPNKNCDNFFNSLMLGKLERKKLQAKSFKAHTYFVRVKSI